MLQVVQTLLAGLPGKLKITTKVCVEVGWKPRREKGGRRVNRSMGDFGHTGAPGRAALPNTFAHLSSFRLPVCINHAS